MLIRAAEVGGRAPLDVRVTGDRITAIAGALAPAAGETVLDAEGGALLPGLHDHHIHLFALAAAAASVRCGPPEVRSIDDLRRVLVQAATAGPAAQEAGAGGGWIRGVGYHESVAGDLDRDGLDRIVADRPVRIQHRSGALWIVSSAALARLGLAGAAAGDAGQRGGARGADVATPGVERDATGRPTGRLFRLDAWLRARLEPAGFPSLAAVGQRLASLGVTGVTDATATNGADEARALTDAVRAGTLPQRLVVMGRVDLPAPDHPSVTRGAVKILLDERALPALADVARTIAGAHAHARPVAIHCVTRADLVLAAAALEHAGVRAGDRIEHASVAPPEVVALLAPLGLTVVTQPGFVRERGDAYLTDVDAADRPWLYRLRGFLAAGIPLGGGSDAPFGDVDPWRAMQAAADRRTAAGTPLGAGERLTPEEALALFTSAPDAPGGPPRRLEIGVVADLCLLDRPWSVARLAPSSARVRATIIGGTVVWRRA